MMKARAERPRGERPHEEPRAERRPVLALDLGGTQVRAAVVGGDGAIGARVARRTPVQDGPDAVLSACVEALRMSREMAASTGHRAIGSLLGIAISTPGPIDPWRGVVGDTPNLGPDFHDIPIAERIEQGLGLPAYLDRDTQIAALGEGAYGAARGLRDYLYVTVSSGVGGAIVSDGRLLIGPDGTAGELGHAPVDFHGPPCGCGGVGHLESFASGVAIARAARVAIEAGVAPDLGAYAERNAITSVEARHVAEAEDAGVATAHAIMDEARRAFASACVGWVNVFDPDLIVVGGSIASHQGDRLLGPAREAITREAFRVPGRRVRIVPAALGDDVSLVGGVVLVNDRASVEEWRGGRPPLVPTQRRPATRAPVAQAAHP